MIWILTAAAAFAADQAAKYYVNRHIKDGRSRSLAGGRIVLERCINRDGAFGSFKDRGDLVKAGSLLGFLVTCAALCAAVIRGENGLKKTGLSLIAGGGLGNLTERLRKGGVTDFLRFRIGSKRLEKIVFNPADLFIFAGALLTAVSSILERKEKLQHANTLK